MEDRFKFRAWNIEEKKMYYNAERTYDYGCSGNGINKESFGCLLDSDYHIVMQCTGLKDKNGTLLFEGDIAQFSIYDGRGIVTHHTAVIVWVDDCWVANGDTACFGLRHARENGYEFEVIGTIHETPKED